MSPTWPALWLEKHDKESLFGVMLGSNGDLAINGCSGGAECASQQGMIANDSGKSKRSTSFMMSIVTQARPPCSRVSLISNNFMLGGFSSAAAFMFIQKGSTQ
jgi:hypothetical protein